MNINLKSCAPLVCAVFLSGCLAKNAPTTKYFTLEAKIDGCALAQIKTAVEISPTDFLDAAESREILTVKDGSVTTFKDARFIDTPSEMIYQNLISAVNDSCDFRVELNGAPLKLESKILAMQIKENEARILLGFSIFKNEKILKSEILDERATVTDGSAQAAVKAMNTAFAQSINKILKKLKEVK